MAILPRYNEIVELLKKGSTIEAQKKIMELREAALELQEENLELKETIKSIEKKLSIQENLEWESPYYWLKKDNEKEGPFCQQCYDNNCKLIRLQGNGEGYWDCKTCNNGYADSSHNPSPIQSIPSSSIDWSGY